MQIFFLNPIQTILLDVIAWLIIQITIGFCSSKIPLDRLDPDQPFFQTFHWEKGGEIYEQLFHVRTWKHLIPNGSRLYPGAFSIKHLPTQNEDYLARWLKESIRAEICHWTMIVPCIFFFLWNGVSMGWIMVAYAFLSNLVPIVLQRYNRPRLRKLLSQQEKITSKKAFPYVPQKEFSHSY